MDFCFRKSVESGHMMFPIKGRPLNGGGEEEKYLTGGGGWHQGGHYAIFIEISFDKKKKKYCWS